MTIEEKLSRTLNDGLARIDVPPGDLPAVRAQGRRLRRNRRLLGSGIALTLVLGGSALFAATRVGGDDRGLDPVDSRRDLAVDRDRAGLTQVGCAVRLDRDRGAVHRRRNQHALSAQRRLRRQPDGSRRDGAAYNPTTHQWREIAAAPVPMPYYFRSAMVGDTFVVFGEGHWYAYDAGDDAWRTLPQPPSPVTGPSIPQRGRRQGLRAGQSWGGPGARRRAGHVVSPAGQRPATSAHAAHRCRRR